ncbi:MAG: response regulator [Burkholderiaceae bacterium]|nr:response regulator [Burkholderiaceae bacterium]
MKRMLDAASWPPAASLIALAGCLTALVVIPMRIGLTARRLTRELSAQKERLERSERLHRLTLDAIDADIALYDAEDRVVLFNRHCREMYGALGDLLAPGLRFEDLLRATVARGLVPQAVGREDEWIAQRQREHAQPRGALLRELPGDRWRRIVEQRLGDGSLLVFSTDVTEHVRREKLIQRSAEELARARDEAVAASSAKSAFVANMSHEIRTPLTSIIGFADLLQSPQLADDEKAAALFSIIRNGHHLLELINNILDLSKIETGQMEVERIDVALPVLLRDIHALVAGRARDKQLQFAVLPRLPLPARLVGDPVRLKQILLNLCSNAIKFTRRGSVTLEVRHVAEPPQLVFTVSDTGIGMTPQQLARLFQPFVQADVSTTRRFGGSGLGLYLSRQLAHALGATITVDSAPEAGSRFELQLPLDPASAAGAMLTQQGDLEVQERADFAPSAFLVPQLCGELLLAEDGIDNQRLLSAYLKQAGLAVTVVDNGRDAVESALARDFDLVLMDIQMPVLDGMAATRLLRSAGYAGPIVALTANVMKSDMLRYREIGCNDVLAKPVDRERFYDVIAAQLASDPGRLQAADTAFGREMEALGADFRARLPQRMAAMSDALARADWGELRAQAHVLKGTAGSFGFDRLGELSRQLEREIVAGGQAAAARLCEGLLREAKALAG